MLTTLTAAIVAMLAGTATQAPTTRPTTAPGDAQSERAEALTGRELARKLYFASGGEVLDDVERIRFTFNVEAGGELRLSARHDWNLTTGIDRVTVDGQTVEVNVNSPGDDEAQKRAFARWTNDSYWLLAPLKFLDPGINYGPVATTRDMPPSRAMMTVSFDDVGLTPGDKYDLVVDLQTGLLRHWTYRPNAETAIGFTWEAYQDFNGLTLATNHVSDDGSRRIFFTDVEVVRAEQSTSQRRRDR